MVKHKFILPVLAVALVAGAVGATAVNAQTASPQSSLVQKLAQRFNLNQADVQKVFDENHQAHHEQMQAALEQRLSQAVSDGKITDAQKAAILNKLKDMEANKPNRDAFKTMTPEQRKQAMDQKKTDLENWAKANGLTLETLQSLIGHGGKGFGMHGPR